MEHGADGSIGKFHGLQICRIADDTPQRLQGGKPLPLHTWADFNGVTLVMASRSMRDSNRQHIRRVAEYTKVLARELGFSPEETENIGLASTMHDIGKLMIPSEILDKPGKLTDAEYGIIKTHPTYGGQLLENVEGDIIRLARTIALEHHERPDGRGYPGALKGEEISLEYQDFFIQRRKDMSVLNLQFSDLP